MCTVWRTGAQFGFRCFLSAGVLVSGVHCIRSVEHPIHSRSLGRKSKESATGWLHKLQEQWILTGTVDSIETGAIRKLHNVSLCAHYPSVWSHFLVSEVRIVLCRWQQLQSKGYALRASIATTPSHGQTSSSHHRSNDLISVIVRIRFTNSHPDFGNKPSKTDWKLKWENAGNCVKVTYVMILIYTSSTRLSPLMKAKHNLHTFGRTEIARINLDIGGSCHLLILFNLVTLQQ